MTLTQKPVLRRQCETDAYLVAIDEDRHVRPLADIHADVLKLALEHYDYNLSEVSRRLKIGRSTVYRHL